MFGVGSGYTDSYVGGENRHDCMVVEDEVAAVTVVLLKVVAVTGNAVVSVMAAIMVTAVAIERSFIMAVVAGPWVTAGALSVMVEVTTAETVIAVVLVEMVFAVAVAVAVASTYFFQSRVACKCPIQSSYFFQLTRTSVSVHHPIMNFCVYKSHFMSTCQLLAL